MASFMEVLQASRRSQNFSTIAYCSLYQAKFSCRAATKEIQRVIDTLMMGSYTVTYEGLYVSVRILYEERAHAN